MNVSWTTANCDTTAPVITPDVQGTLGNNGWYTSDVDVSWSVVDNESTISSKSASCDTTTTINTDTTGQTVSCTATSAGGTDTKSVTIKRDATAPTNVAGELDRAADSNGWYNHAVNATFTGDDPTSGIASCSSDGAYSGPDGTGKTVTGSCTDNAGNSANGSSPTFNYDATAPDATADADRSADQGGWYNAPFTVSFSGTDATSGNVSCDPDVNYNGPDTNSDSISGSCTDEAGNSDSATFNFKYDNTDPTINGSASPAANGNGWNNSDVTVSFTCSDATSGVPAGNCPANVVLSEGADQSVTRSVTDAAGNTASDTVSDINIDKTDPNVALNGGPANGQSYYFGSVPNAPTCTASDALSGLAGPCTVSGYGTTVGSHTVTASATDNADNNAEASSTYTVLAWTTKGFYAPVDMGGVYNTVKGGSTVPLKFELFSGATELTDTSAIKSLTATKSTCAAGATEDAIEVTATGGTSLRYDSTGGQFIYNWKTPTGAGCYTVTMTAQDGSTITAYFKSLK